MNDPPPDDDPPADGSPVGDDPRRIRIVVVRADDVVTALEARERSGRRTLLRVTPPFAARERARLHEPVAETIDSSTRDDSDDPRPINLPPETLVRDPPAFPRPDETADRLREEGQYDVGTHRDRHADAVERWRATVADRIRGTVTFDLAEGGVHGVEVRTLG